MERSRRPWAGHSRRDDKKRDHRDEFDEFLEKKKRELAEFKVAAFFLRFNRCDVGEWVGGSERFSKREFNKGHWVGALVGGRVRR